MRPCRFDVDQFGESRISVVELVSLLSFEHGTHDEHIGVGCEALDSFQKALRRVEPAKMRTVAKSSANEMQGSEHHSGVQRFHCGGFAVCASFFAFVCETLYGTSQCFCVHSMRSLLNSGRVAPIVFPLPLLDDNCFSRPRSRCYGDWPISQCWEVFKPVSHTRSHDRKAQVAVELSLAQLSRTMQWWDTIFHSMTILSPTRVLCV